jgi:hypothetical protein
MRIAFFADGRNRRRKMACQQEARDKVQTSGIYRVVKEGGGSRPEATHVEGEHLRLPETITCITSWFTRLRIRPNTANRAAATDLRVTIVGGISKTLLLFFASTCLLAGCAVGAMPPPGRHLTDIECRDLGALKANKNTTMAEHQVELGALRKAGYNPSPFWDDPYYPEDLQDAQRRVDYWYQTECVPTANAVTPSVP